MEVFEAIAQPTRREILRLLAEGELSAGRVASRFSVTQPAISQHLKVLREAGLISERREGKRRLYRPRSDGRAEPRSLFGQGVPPSLHRLQPGAQGEEPRGRAP